MYLAAVFGLYVPLMGPMSSGLQFQQTNVGLTYGSGNCGVAAGDLDMDGFIDLVFCGDPKYGIRIFHNNGNKTFTDVSEIALPVVPNASEVILADVNNDMEIDMIVARRYSDTTESDVGLDIYMNMMGCFFPVGLPDGYLRRPEAWGGMTVGDFDGDRFLDIVTFRHGGIGQALKNLTEFQFADGSSMFAPTINATRQYFTPVWCDYNKDRRPDLFCGVDHGADLLWNNMGGGTFLDVSTAAGVTNIGADMGTAVGDFDNDGDFDLYTTNIGFHCLYVNDGTGKFKDGAAAHGCRDNGGQIEMAWGTQFVDFDNDGDLDLIYVAEGATGALFENDGTGNYTDVSSTAGVLPLLGIGMVSFDYDNDGDLDFVRVGAAGGPRFYENVSPGLAGNHWLRLKPMGTHGNMDGVGAVAEVTVGGKTLIRPIVASESMFTGVPIEAHFGLGTATKAKVRMLWPTGAATVLEDVDADQFLHVMEPVCGDVNRDKTVDIFDVCMILVNLYANNKGDVNGDAVTDLKDLNLCLQNYGFTCP